MLLSSEICLQSRYKKVFTEPSWTTEEVIFSGACQSMYQVGLIHIYISVQPQIFKILYSNRIFHTQLHLIQPINKKNYQPLVNLSCYTVTLFGKIKLSQNYIKSLILAEFFHVLKIFIIFVFNKLKQK